MGEPETIDREEIAMALSSSVGEEKAREAVAEAAEHLGLFTEALSHSDALEVLAQVASGQGLLSLTARFTRSRLLARWATETLKRHDTGPMRTRERASIRAAGSDES